MISFVYFGIALLSFLLHKFTLQYFTVFENITKKLLFVNILRFTYSILSSYFLYNDQQYASWILFIIGAPTFCLNTPRLKIHKKEKQSTKHIHFSIISSSFFVLPIMFSFVNKNEIFDNNLVFIYLTSELWFSAYPTLKFQRNRNLLIQIKEFLSLSGLYYAFKSQSHRANVQILSAIVISASNFIFTSIPQFWYANIISLLNMACGILALYKQIFEFSDSPQFRVLFLVLLGQFFDVFDGRAADRFGSTKHGEMFDDAADFTSFGVASGVLVYQFLCFNMKISHFWSCIFGVGYVSAVAFRLVRFVVNKAKAGQVGGVRFFEGLPSPGTSAFTICFTVVLQSLQKQQEEFFGRYERQILSFYIGLLVVVLGLTVSKIKYAHFGRVFASKNAVSHKIKAIFGFTLVSVVSQTIVSKNPDAIVCFCSTGIIWYIFSPVLCKTIYNQEENIAEVSESE